MEGEIRRDGPSDAQRLKSLEDENRRLKKLLAEAMLALAARKDLLAKLRSPAAQRTAAPPLMARHGFSQLHACRLVEVDPKTVRRAAMVDAPEIRQRLRDLAGGRRRFGCRRLGILLVREGMTMNHKKLYRLYGEEGLTVRRRRGRKRPTGTRTPITIPQAANQRWPLDFVADVLVPGSAVPTSGDRGRLTREALALVVDTSIGGRRGVPECGPRVASPPRPRTSSPRAPRRATPTSSAARPLPSKRRRRYEEPGLSLPLRDRRGAGQSS